MAVGMVSLVDSPHVDVVIGIDRLVAAFFPAQRDIGQVGQHLVGIHVVAGAGAGLEAIHHELVQIFPLQDALAGRDNGVALIRWQPAGLAVGVRGGELDEDVGANEIRVWPASGNGKIVDRAGGLDAIPGILRNLVLAQGVSFGTKTGHNA